MINKFVVIEGKRYVMRDGIPVKLYWGRRRNKASRGGFARVLNIKSICKFCGKEFLHEIYNLGNYCSHTCRSKGIVKYVVLKRRLKHIIVPGQFNLELKRITWNRTTYLISKKFITPPKYCSCCKQTGRIEAHHFNYYRPYEVIWLCRLCHRRIHYGYNVNGEISNYNEIALKRWGNDMIEIAKIG